MLITQTEHFYSSNEFDTIKWTEFKELKKQSNDKVYSKAETQESLHLFHGDDSGSINSNKNTKANNTRLIMHHDIVQFLIPKRDWGEDSSLHTTMNLPLN